MHVSLRYRLGVSEARPIRGAMRDCSRAATRSRLSRRSGAAYRAGRRHPPIGYNGVSAVSGRGADASPASFRQRNACATRRIAAPTPTSHQRAHMSFNNVPSGKDLPQDFNVIIEIPGAKRSGEVRSGQGHGPARRRPLYRHGHALSGELRLHSADAVRRRRSGRRAGDHAVPAAGRLGGARPRTRHAANDRRIRRRREAGRGARTTRSAR